MKEKIEACFNRLQTMTITASLDTMEKLVQTLYDLREIYQQMEGNDAAEAE